jgi:hypothetical protein
VDPTNPYPKQFTGHLKATLRDGSVHEQRQAYFKGGLEHPLSDEDLAFKFYANCAHGGLPRAQAEALAAGVDALFERPLIDTRSLQA